MSPRHSAPPEMRLRLIACLLERDVDHVRKLLERQHSLGNFAWRPIAVGGL